MIRTIIQSEASECGLASLAMVFSAHGSELGIAELRRRFPLSLKGANLNDLIKVCDRTGFHARALRLDLAGLSKLRVPCILHWDLNHFVVLSSAGSKYITILDPAVGKRQMSLAEASQHFTGIALEVAPRADFKPEKAPSLVTLRQLTGPIRGLFTAIIQIVLLSLALQLFVIVSPFFMQWVVDQALIAEDKNLLATLALGFGLLVLVQVGTGLFRGWTITYLSSRLGLQWLGNVVSHAIYLPLDYFQKRHLGDITSRLASVQSIQRILTSSFIEAIIDGAMAIATLILMAVYSWKLACITFAAVCIYTLARMLVYRPMRDCTERQLIASANQQTYILETFRGMQSVKVSGIEALRLSVHQTLMGKTVDSDVQLSRMVVAFLNFRVLIFGLERIVVIWIGALLAMKSLFSIGMLIAYLAYKDQFAERAASLVDKWVDFRMLKLHGERLADLVLTPCDARAETYQTPRLEAAEVSVQNLAFRYSFGEPWVLQDVSFTIKDGESVAIIGPSGCGKTTLVKVLLGLLAPNEGSIRIGGFDLHKTGPENVRTMIGVVMQDDHLFSGTISENICLFSPESDIEQIESAAKLAAVHDEIMAMPMGYQTLIGDMGNSLSGGQKQRIMLARALYRRPRILILDEATSHLDVAKERLVNESVQNLRITKIIIAHRPETIASADRVVALEKGGRIREFMQPSHELTKKHIG